MSRTPDEFLRIYGPPAYRDWGRRLPCIVVGCETTDRPPDGGSVIEQWHVTTGGMSRKADWTWTLWGCWRHHRLAQHQKGTDTFERTHALRVDAGALGAFDVASLHEAALVTQYLFKEYENGLAY